MQSPWGTSERSLLIGATLLTITIALAGWSQTKAAEQIAASPSAPGDAEGPVVQKKQPPYQILLDVRVATMEPRDRSILGSWRAVALRDDESAVLPAARTGRRKIRKPVKAQVLCASDPVATESLLARIKTLEESGRLHTLTNLETIVRDGDDALLKSIQHEWFLMLGLQAVHRYLIDGAELEAYMGPAVSMTARIGDSNDITITTASEISNRDPMHHLHHRDSEIVLRQSETYSIALKDGGTMAWAGLVQRDPKDGRCSGLGGLPLIGGLFRGHKAAEQAQDTVIFVTAQLVPELLSPTTPKRP